MRGFLIGNGFDLAHGMRSKFGDFYNYEIINNPSNIICFEQFYNISTEEIGGNFENTIGRIDYEYFMSFMGSIYNEKDDYELTYCVDDIDFEHLFCNYCELAKDISLWKNGYAKSKKYIISRRLIAFF